MKLSVLVTSYGRRAYLQRCLESLLISQERVPDEVVVVTRTCDFDTQAYVEGLLASYEGEVALCHARVEEPGVLAANRAGMTLVTGDIVCFIDDDATARPPWLRRIEEHYLADATLGAVGGHDVQHTRGGIVEQPAARVGKIHWYGRIVGNHEKAFHGTCLVDHLKGVNMSFRRELLALFDDRQDSGERPLLPPVKHLREGDPEQPERRVEPWLWTLPTLDPVLAGGELALQSQDLRHEDRLRLADAKEEDDEVSAKAKG